MRQVFNLRQSADDKFSEHDPQIAQRYADF